MLRIASLSLKTPKYRTKSIFGIPYPTTETNVHFSSAQPIHEYEYDEFDCSRLQKVTAQKKIALPVDESKVQSRPLDLSVAKIFNVPFNNREGITVGKQESVSNMSSADAKSMRTAAANELSYYPDGKPIPITSRLEIIHPGGAIPHGVWPVFRLMVRFCLAELFPIFRSTNTINISRIKTDTFDIQKMKKSTKMRTPAVLISNHT
jgi:hypothetical protein